MAIEFNSESIDAYSDLFDELWPICRSITGAGLRQSLAIFGRHMPLEIEGVASGTTVYDWTVPPEWTIASARLTGPDGSVIADMAVSNLHVLNYSQPVDRTMPLEELQAHLHSIPHQPDLIPYCTSYYAPRWGFCLSHKAREALKPGLYHARIDSRLAPGEVNFATATLPGDTAQEVLLTSYLCHPSLANNELSGPLVLLGLYHRLRRWPRRRLSYRFLFNPETIGSLCFMHRHEDHVMSSTVAGLVLTCLGGPNTTLSYKMSRAGDGLMDALAGHLARLHPDRLVLRPFAPTSGSDERQFCAPGFNLPMGQVARTVYGDFPQYHTSGDTKAFMDIARIVDAVDRIEEMLLAHELAGPWRSTAPKGEPQLGRRDLYPSVNSPTNWGRSDDSTFDARATLNLILWALSDANGQRPVWQSAEKAGQSMFDMVPVLRNLEGRGLMQRVGDST